MSLRRASIGLVFLFASVALAPVPGLASEIDVQWIGAGNTWSWSGGTGSSLTSTGGDLRLNVLGSTTVVNLPTSDTITWTSGPATGGTGTATDQFMWASGGSITITGCGGTCFKGTFTGVQTGLIGATGLEVDSLSVSGTFNSAIYSMLGLPSSTPLTIVGEQTSNLGFTSAPTFASGGSGLTGGGTQIDTTSRSIVPEPASLVLLGAGFFVIGVFAFRRQPGKLGSRRS